jgi:Cytochrome c3
LSISICGWIAAAVFYEGAATHAALAPARSLLLPGKTTHGHHQIELACESCHSSPFGGRQSMQKACETCHAAELKEANDTHPQKKFTDPRNADRLEKLDATLCVTCHVEHRPAATHAMGLSLPKDFCFHCHAEIAKDRPSHAGMGFETCNSAGCHKFHDNRALYEDFLAKHLSDPPLRASPALPPREIQRRKPVPEPDAKADPAVVRDWLETAHANAGVNCSACHKSADPKASCAECHAPEAKGFLAGKHGMRIAAGLSPMKPSLARRAMRPDAAHQELGCTSCHAAHRFDTQKAATQACAGCHRGAHVEAFEKSAHRASGMTCASCHLPRVEWRDEDAGTKRILVQHNQNQTLEPSEKMIRPVCLHCHGLGFSIDALAGRKVESLDMVKRRFLNKEGSSK